MSSTAYTIILMNSMTFVIGYVTSFFIKKTNEQQDKIEYLCDKVCRLEKKLLLLEEVLKNSENSN